MLLSIFLRELVLLPGGSQVKLQLVPEPGPGAEVEFRSEADSVAGVERDGGLVTSGFRNEKHFLKNVFLASSPHDLWLFST